jgi:hypothetical protein
MENIFFSVASVKGKTGQSPKNKAAAAPVVEEIIDPELKKQRDAVSALTKQIHDLKTESQQFNTPSTYAKFSKMQRQATKLEDDLEQEKTKLAQLEANSKPVTSTPSATSTHANDTQDTVTEPTPNATAEKLNYYFKMVFTACRHLFPLILVYIFRNANYPMYMNSEKLLPLSSYLGVQNGDYFTLNFNIVWFFMCFRMVNRIKAVRQTTHAAVKA